MSISFPAVSLLKEVRTAQYIKEKTKDGDTIYAWDTSASLYQKSGRLSAVSLVSNFCMWEQLKIVWVFKEWT